jgi:CRP-like cAMP-binding protein
MFSVIKSLELFQNIHLTTLESLASTVKIKSYKKGAFLNADPSNAYFYNILKGHVKYFKETQDGKETVIDVLSAPHFLGENLCFNRHYKLHHTQCIETVELMAWPTTSIRKWLHEDHQLSLNFLENKMKEQCHLESYLEELSTQSAEQRIGDLLLKLYNENKKKFSQKTSSQQKEFVMKLPYDKALIAAKLNMRPETFTRVLHKLAAQCQMKIAGSLLSVSAFSPNPFAILN